MKLSKIKNNRRSMIKAKAIEKHWKQRAEANAFVKKNYFDTSDSEKDRVFWNKKKYLMNYTVKDLKK